MKFSKLMKWSFRFTFLVLGALFLNINPAFAVADLNINITSGAQPLGGSSVSLTFPDGSTIQRDDLDNDGKIGILLGDPGAYRLTITTPDGASRSTTFDAPASGSVTVDYDQAGATPPRVSVNDTSSPSRTARSSRDDSGSPFSASILGSYGMSKWDIEGGNTIFQPDQLDLKKWGIGFGLRYEIPNTRLFVANRFYYHPRGRTDPNIDVFGFASFEVFEIEEKWKNQMLLGWTFFDNNGVRLNLLGGITLAKINLKVLSSNDAPGSGLQSLTENNKIQVAPTLGLESEVPLNIGNMGQVFWIFGTTLALMNSLSISDEEEENELFRIDSDLQWDIHTGFRIRF